MGVGIVCNADSPVFNHKDHKVFHEGRKEMLCLPFNPMFNHYACAEAYAYAEALA